MLVNTPYGLPNEPTTTIAQSACYNIYCKAPIPTVQ